MSETIQAYLARYFDPSLNESVMRRRSLQQAKKYQAFYEFLDLERSRLLRQKQEPSGLRNIGNTCYFNVFMQLLYHINSFRDMFLQGSLRTERGQGSTLPSQLQNLFGQMLFSKFAYCDPSQAFLTLNRSNPDRIQLGDQYDLNEYFAITLDTIEKCLAKEPTLESRAKILDRVFYGKMNQHFDDGKDQSNTSVKFGVINLDVKLGSLEKAFEVFKNYEVEGYKNSIGKPTKATVKSEITSFPQLMTFYVNRVELKGGKLSKNNSRFTYPQNLQFNKNGCEYRLNKESEQLEKKIAKVQKLIEQKEYTKLLESLRNTEKFLEMQEFDDIADLSLGLKELNYNYGVVGAEASHEETKKRLRHYIQKLEKQQQLLQSTLESLKQEKKQLAEKCKTTQYNLFAVMMHQGSAVSGHYFIYIYNENQRKWRKYNDRFVSEVSAQEVHKAAMGEGNSSTGASCLIYKTSDFKCDPFCKPPVSASLKSSVMKYDEFVAEHINRVRLERMLRNCTDLAKEELEYFVEGFQFDPINCVSYFSNPVYYWIGAKNLKVAEYVRLNELISQPAWLMEANTNQLPPAKDVVIPHMNGAELPIEYGQICLTIKMAMEEQNKNNINTSLLYLLTRRHLALKFPVMRELYDKIIIIFLLKSCFYLDLKMQTNEDTTQLFELIKFAKSSLGNSLYTLQIDDNLRYSMGGQYNDKVNKINLSDKIFKDVIGGQHINIERVMYTRFKIWVEFFRQIANRKNLIKQESRIKEEIVQLMNYIK